MPKSTISSALRDDLALSVVGVVRRIDIADASLSVEFAFNDLQGRRQTTRMALSWTVSTRVIARHLLNQGAAFGASAALEAHIERELERRASWATIEESARTGWYGNDFLLPTGVVGRSNRLLRFIGNTGEHPLEGAGTLDEWLSRTAAPCRRFRTLRFAMATIFAGPLLRFADFDGGLAFVFSDVGGGDAATTLHAGRSVGCMSTRARTSAKVQAIRATELAAAHDDMTHVIHEVGRPGRMWAGWLKRLLGLASGAPCAGRNRFEGISSDTHVVLPRSIVLARAEGPCARREWIGAPIDDHGGYLIEVPGPNLVDPGRGGQEVEGMIPYSSDLALRAFIQAVVDDRAHFEAEVPRMISEFVLGLIDLRTASSQEVRVVRAFGLICAAGRLAACAGLAPWTEEACINASTTLYRRHRELMECTSPVELARRLLACATDSLRFPVVEEGDRLDDDTADKCWGVCRAINGRSVIAVRLDQLAAVLGLGAMPRALTDSMIQAGFLWLTDGGAPSRQVKVLGWRGARRPRFYCFLLDVLRTVAATDSARPAIEGWALPISGARVSSRIVASPAMAERLREVQNRPESPFRWNRPVVVIRKRRRCHAAGLVRSA